MTEKRTPGIPEEPCKRVAPAKASSEVRLEALQNIFLSPPKFVVGTTASEQAYQLMVGTKGGLSAFWEDAKGFHHGRHTPDWLIHQVDVIEAMARTKSGRSKTRLMHNARTLLDYHKYFAGRPFDVLAGLKLGLDFGEGSFAEGGEARPADGC